MTKLEFLHKITARLRHNAIWMPFLSATGKKINNKNWIFIVGCYNSGTTLLDQILASHSKISGLPDEGVMLTNQLTRPEDFNWQRMWSECLKEMRSSSRDQKKDSGIIKKHWSHFYDLDCDFLVEKSISNMTRLEFFNKNFNPNIFIHITRNPYAVAEGIYRKAEPLEGNPYQGKSYPMEICARQWVESINLFEKEKKDLANYIEIKYEDLSTNPAEVVNNLLEKLNLDLFPKDYFDNAFSVHEKKSKIKNMNDSSFKRLKKEDYKAINKIAKDTMLKYGYEIREE